MRSWRFILSSLSLSILVSMHAPVTARLFGLASSADHQDAPLAPPRIVNFASGGRQVLRVDQQGHAIDAHDGEIRMFGGKYYLYGTSYDCGFQFAIGALHNPPPPAVFCGFKSYSSSDLLHWKDEGLLFDPDPYQELCRLYGCFRPHVLFNADTRLYVLWINATRPGDDGFRVFTSPSPTGPFLEQPQPRMARGPGNGDHNLFLDDDGAAYIAYSNYNGTPNDHFNIVIERLNSTFTHGTGQFLELGTAFARAGKLGNPNHLFGEAPAMFKRSGRYYLLYNFPGCPYCSGGVSKYISTTSAPLDAAGWTAGDQVLISETSCGGQPAHVAVIAGKYLFMSDLWHQIQPFDYLNPVDQANMFRNEGRANYHWEPLAFDEAGAILPLSCSPSVENDYVITPGSRDPIPNVDQFSGVDGFSNWCDIGHDNGAIQRMQTLKPGQSGMLASLSIMTFQSGNLGNILPGGSLIADLVEVDDSGKPGAILKRFEIEPRSAADGHQLLNSKIGFSPRQMYIEPQIRVNAGREYGILLHAPLKQGCYGIAYNDDDPYPEGRSLLSTDGGKSWQIESGRDLLFSTTISNDAAPRMPRSLFHRVMEKLFLLRRPDQ